MTTLYRKYRPQSFKEIIGQTHIKTTLEYEVSNDKVAHAYLFCGPRAVGKTSISRILSKAINCTERKEGESNPCNTCETCLEITAGTSLDINEIDAASNTGVDNVRENIIAASKSSASKCKFKVFIIDEVHMMSNQAFNALLKTLEEPPANVVFIICTTEVHKVPATIISRCQRFDFKKISIEEIAQKLKSITKKENIEISQNIINTIARHSEGHMRDAESLLGQVLAVGGRNVSDEEANLVIPRSDITEVLKLIKYIGTKNSTKSILLINKIIEEGVNLKRFLIDFIETMRKIMLAKMSPELLDQFAFDLGEDMDIKLKNLSENIDLSFAVKIIERFSKAKNETSHNFIPQLPVELAIAELCLNIAPATQNTPQTKKVSTSTIQAITSQAPIKIKKPQITSQAPTTEKPNDNTVNMSSSNLNFEDIKAKWNEVITLGAKANTSLSYILRACQLSSFENNNIVLVFKYKFHEDKMADNSVKKALENALKEVYSCDLKFSTSCEEDSGNNTAQAIQTSPEKQKETETNKPENSHGAQSLASDKGKQPVSQDKDAINDILDTFGGEVIN